MVCITIYSRTTCKASVVAFRPTFQRSSKSAALTSVRGALLSACSSTPQRRRFCGLVLRQIFARLSPGSHWRQTERHRTSDGRSRPWCADRRGTVNAPARGSVLSDMLLPPASTPTSASTTVVAARLVLSRLDYCNAVLAGLPATTLAPYCSESCVRGCDASGYCCW